MGFESLLGNRRIRDNLQHSLRAGRISHFYLISGPEGSGKHTLARLLAAAILCTGSNAPCGSCAAWGRSANGIQLQMRRAVRRSSGPGTYSFPLHRAFIRMG